MAGLMIKSFLGLLRINPSNLLTMQVVLSRLQHTAISRASLTDELSLGYPSLVVDLGLIDPVRSER